MIYLDSAATSLQKPPEVARAVARAMYSCASLGCGDGGRLNERKLRRAVVLLDERGIDLGRVFLLSRLTGEYREVPL